VVGSTFDHGAFLTALAGNVIWATACFATGGAAFAISLAGIAVGAGAPGASTTVDRAAFHQEASRLIDGIVQQLLNQIDGVTRAVDGEATTGGWDDNRTRQALLSRIFRPEYINTAAGGIPTVNRSPIAHRI